ncbi:MAG: ATP-binding protein [Bacteriovoracales bacterium]|nr:ATP-binding protein [Bacteriovoracales bacterium]
MNKKNALFHYTLNSFEKDFPSFGQNFKEFCLSQKLDPAKSVDMELSLEELIVNSFNHGNKNGPVTIKAKVNEDGLEAILEDEAPPFNPLEDAPPPPKGELETRKVGGLGIHLVKNLNDRIEYSPLKKGNRITLFKSIKASG